MAEWLQRSFFANADTPVVARALVGCHLCRRFGGGQTVRWVLTEVEAYDGPADRACHAHKGETARTRVMFGPPGYFYVYLCYGMHWMLNVVTGPPGYPAAVLIRAAGEVSGPGRLTRRLEIDRALNGQPAVPASGLWLEPPVQRPSRRAVQALPRVGIAYAGAEWAAKPYRFLLRPKGTKFLSPA